MAANRITLTVAAEDQASAAFSAIEKKMEGLGVTLKGLGEAFKFAGGVAAGAAAAFTATVGAMAGVAASATSSAVQMDAMAQRLGLSVERMSELKFASEQANVGVDKLVDGMKGLQMNMASATSGNTAMAEAFENLGISLTDASGKLRATDGVMLDVADAFQAMEDGTNKSAIAMKLFQESGGQLLPFLNQGAAGIREMAAESHNLGAVWTTEAKDAALEFGATIDRITTLLGGLKNIVGVESIAAFQPLIDTLERVGKVVVAWAAANKARIKDFFDTMVSITVFAMKTVGTVTVDATNVLLKTITGLVEAASFFNSSLRQEADSLADLTIKLDNLSEFIDNAAANYLNLTKKITAGTDAGAAAEAQTIKLGRAVDGAREFTEAEAEAWRTVGNQIQTDARIRTEAWRVITGQSTAVSANTAIVREAIPTITSASEVTRGWSRELGEVGRSAREAGERIGGLADRAASVAVGGGSSGRFGTGLGGSGFSTTGGITSTSGTFTPRFSANDPFAPRQQLFGVVNGERLPVGGALHSLPEIIQTAVIIDGREIARATHIAAKRGVPMGTAGGLKRR